MLPPRRRRLLADPTLITGGRDVAVIPDGRFVYMTGGSGTDGYLRAYSRDGATGMLTPLGCLTYLADPGCSTAAGLANADKLAISPDGRNLYVTAFQGGDGAGAVAAFRIQTAPSCQGASASVVAGSSVSIPLTCTDESGDSITRTIVTSPGKGTLGAIDQAGGTVAYIPAAGFTGADGFSFQAGDGTNTSAPASVSITVAAATSGQVQGQGQAIKGPPPIPGPSSRIIGLAHSVRAAKLKSFHGTASGVRPIASMEIALVRLVGRAASKAGEERKWQ